MTDDSTQHRYTIHLAYEKTTGNWECMVECPTDPGFSDSGNGVGATPQEALETVAANWENEVEH